MTEDFSYKGFDDFPSNIKQLEYFHPDILVVLEDLNFTMDTSQFRWAGAPTNPRYRSSQYRKRVIVTSSWKTYDVRNEKTINECTFRDTVIYYLYGNINKGSNLDVRYPYHKYGYTSYLTNDMNENDLKSIASYEGIEYARWIAPHLAKTKRFFYSSGNKNLRKAFKEMKKNNWNDAEEIW